MCGKTGPCHTSGCKGEGSIAVTPIGGTAPYSYLWDTGETTSGITNQETGKHCVTITDAGGCSYGNCTELHNSEVQFTVEKECEGMSDGAVNFNIYNPNQGYVKVVFNNNTYYENNAAPTNLTVSVSSVSEGAYTLYWIVDNCSSLEQASSTTVIIGKEPIVDKFKEYDKDKEECVYSQFCKENQIVGSESSQQPIYDFLNASGGFFATCKIPIKCPKYGEVDTKLMRMEWMRAAEYLQLLNEAELFMPSDYLDSRRQFFVNMSLGDCDWVKVCPANLYIGATATGFGFLNDEADPIEGSPGCFELDCTPLNPLVDDDFCISETIQDFYPLQGNDIELCNARSENVLRLINFITQLQGFPDFAGSELDLFLNANIDNPSSKCARVTFCLNKFRILATDIDKVDCCIPQTRTLADLLNDYDDLYFDPNFIGSDLHYFMEDNIALGNKLCATVIYCSSNYSILGSNINEVNCLSPTDLPMACTLPDDCAEQQDGICVPIVCYNKNSPNVVQYCGSIAIHGTFVDQCNAPGWLDGFTGDDDDEFRKIVTTPSDGRVFRGFAKTFIDGSWQPDGIVGAQDDRFYLDYSLSAKRDATYLIPGLISVLVDSEHGSSTFWITEKMSNQVFDVNYKSDSKEWIQKIEVVRVSRTHFSKVKSY